MMSNAIADVLDKAADLIEPEGAWTQGWTARLADRSFTYSLDPQAVCWCVGGAIVRVSDDEASRAEAARMLRVVSGFAAISDFNDVPGRTQAEAVAKLREAAAKAREMV